MSLQKRFWESIAKDIEIQFKRGHPSTWNQERINIFLSEFESEIRKNCQGDNDKARKCGLPISKETKDWWKWSPINPSTISRIFKYKTSLGKDKTKHQFAIYLGFASYQDYINQKGIISEHNYLPPPLLSQPEQVQTKWSKAIHGWLFLLWAIIALLFSYIFHGAEDLPLSVLRFLIVSIFISWIFFFIQRKRKKLSFSNAYLRVFNTFFILSILANSFQLKNFRVVEFYTLENQARLVHDFNSSEDDITIAHLVSGEKKMIKIPVGKYKFILDEGKTEGQERLFPLVVVPFWKAMPMQVLTL